MTKSRQRQSQDEPREPARPVRAKNPPAGAATLAEGQLVSFLVQITREVWRLGSAIERSRIRGEPASDEIEAAWERLQEELQALGLQANDPVGQKYEPGQRVEIAHLEPGGSGDLLIKRTVLPGVTLNGTMLKPASVVVGRKDTP